MPSKSHVSVFVLGFVALAGCSSPNSAVLTDDVDREIDAVGQASRLDELEAPAGDLPATRHVLIDGLDAAVLPNGRLVTPAGVEVNIGATKPFGLALSPDGRTLATTNNG